MPVSPTSSLKDSALPTACPQTEAVFRRTSNGYARLYFLKNSMSASVVEAFFMDAYFRVDHAFDFPPEIVHDLQLVTSSVQPGLYKMREYKEFFIIDFEPLKKSRGSSYAQD